MIIVLTNKRVSNVEEKENQQTKKKTKTRLKQYLSLKAWANNINNFVWIVEIIFTEM